MEKSSKVFVGMDVHKESIDITLAEQGGEVHRLGQIGGDRISLLKMVRKQRSRGRERVFVYEAGPCGFWIYREITALGQACMVVSPALVPKRAGELEAIHMPDIRDEAIPATWCALATMP
jgi:transposase